MSMALAAVPRAAAAQPAPTRVVEVSAAVGYASFVDESPIPHAVFGGLARVALTPRLAAGPQVIYMIGPRSDRDLFVTGFLTYDLIGPAGGRSRIVPYLVTDAGVMTHFESFNGRTFSSTEGAVSGGVGVRVRPTERVVASVDLRVGWELHWRTVVSVGYRIGGR
jgi:hypothetical protein